MTARRHPQGHGQEHHRFRRVHRPQRHRRPAPHHRHELGPHRPSLGNAEGRPGNRRRGARREQGKGTRQPRPQAEDWPIRGTRSTRNIPVGAKVKGKVVNLVPYGAFVRTRTRRRRPRARHRTVLDQAHRQARPTCSSRTRKSKPSCWASTRGAENLPRHPPARSQSLGHGRHKYPSAPASRARCATSPATARSSNWKKALTA